MLKAIVEAGSALFFPKVCGSCPDVLPSTNVDGVCADCASRVRRIAAPFCPRCGRTASAEGRTCGLCEGAFHFDRAYAALYYEGRVRQLLRDFKYAAHRPLGRFFSGVLIDFMEKNIGPASFDALAAVPMDPPKEDRRGFNQARLLTRALARRTGKPDLSDGLVRKGSSRAQAFLDKRGRAANIAGSFAVPEPSRFREKRVLLVDDILTTGATASECARTLKGAGAASVTVLAAARGI